VIVTGSELLAGEQISETEEKTTNKKSRESVQGKEKLHRVGGFWEHAAPRKIQRGWWHSTKETGGKRKGEEPGSPLSAGQFRMQ